MPITPRPIVRLAVALLATGLALSPKAIEAQAPLPKDSLELGRKYAFWLMSGTADSLVANMRPDVVAALGGRDGLLEGTATIANRAGTEVRVIEERFIWRNGQRQYLRKSQMSILPEPFVLRFVMLADGSVAGIGMSPESAAPPADSGGPAIRKP